MLHWNLHNWPEWKHQFQLFLATLDHLEDSQKLTLLCYSLGPDGLAIACKLFPELANRNPTASKSVAFATVWWQFNEHCWARYSPQIDPLKDLQVERNQLKQICDEAMGKVSLIILRLETTRSFNRIPFHRLSTTSSTNSSRFCHCASWSSCVKGFLRWSILCRISLTCSEFKLNLVV